MTRKNHYSTMNDNGDDDDDDDDAIFDAEISDFGGKYGMWRK